MKTILAVIAGEERQEAEDREARDVQPEPPIARGATAGEETLLVS